MKILAIDTSTLVMGVAVLEEKKVLGELITNSKKKHSIRLMPAIAHLLTELELTFEQIDLIAVTSGPGSYTGIRIGVATAKTLAWTNNLPLYGVSTLTVLATNGHYFKGCVVPLLDARRERVYAGVYQGGQPSLSVVVKPQVLVVNDLLDRLAEQDQSVLFLGDDVFKFKDQITQKLQEKAVFGAVTQNIPKPSQLGFLAWQKWLNNELSAQANFTPDYLQLTQAEVDWLSKQKNEA